MRRTATPGTFVTAEVASDIACIGREAGPNQPR